MKNISDINLEKSKHIFEFNKNFLKIVLFMRKCRNYGTATQARDENAIQRGKEAIFMPQSKNSDTYALLDIYFC